MTTSTPPRTVRAVQTTLDIIELLRARTEVGVTELAAELDRSKGTVHSHLATLRENEYVVKDGDRYRLSLKYLDLGETVKEGVSSYDIICEELESLAAESGELAQCATEEHGRAVYLHKAAGENAVQTASSPGTREHMHCISLGKALLAFMPDERVDRIVERHGLPRYTDRTITSRERLQAELEEIRERGVAFDEEERIEGIRCVAAPVMVDGEVLAAISVSGPSARMRGERFREQLPSLVTRSANVIEINTRFT